MHIYYYIVTDLYYNAYLLYGRQRVYNEIQRPLKLKTIFQGVTDFLHFGHQCTFHSM